MEYLTTKEAMQALLDGKKIIHKNSDDGYYEYLNNSGDLVYKNGMPANLSRVYGYSLYEEKLELKKDPYIGKQVIPKGENTNDRYMVINYTEQVYHVKKNDYHIILTENDLKENYYIEGIDF